MKYFSEQLFHRTPLGKCFWLRVAKDIFWWQLSGKNWNNCYKENIEIIERIEIIIIIERIIIRKEFLVFWKCLEGHGGNVLWRSYLEGLTGTLKKRTFPKFHLRSL